MSPDVSPPSDPCEILPHCPICPAGLMAASTHLRDLYVCVCLTCGTTLSVPDEAMKQLRRRDDTAATS